MALEVTTTSGRLLPSAVTGYINAGATDTVTFTGQTFGAGVYEVLLTRPDMTEVATATATLAAPAVTLTATLTLAGDAIDSILARNTTGRRADCVACLFDRTRSHYLCRAVCEAITE